MNHDLIKKIDFVVKEVNKQKNDFEYSLNVSTQNLRILTEKEGSNTKQYRYDLERFNLGVISAKAGISKSDLYIKRCLAYQEYLKSLEKNDLIISEKAKFQFIRAFQEEAIMDLNHELAKRRQIKIIENIAGENGTVLQSQKELSKREDLYDRFLGMDFVMDPSKIKSTFYLNYKTEELIDVLYPKKEKNRQAA